MDNTKILIVLACEVKEKDSITNTETLLRCRSSLKKWQEGNYDKILVCGGIFLSPRVQTKPASVIMADWLKEQGVKEEDIVTEESSRDTFENIFFGIKKLKENGIKPKNSEIYIVSQWQHSLRIWITLKRCYQFRKVKMERSYIKTSWKNFFKEWLFIFYHLYDKDGAKPPARQNRNQRHNPNAP